MLQCDFFETVFMIVLGCILKTFVEIDSRQSVYTFYCVEKSSTRNKFCVPWTKSFGFGT